jgi:anti-sigma factor RsiW
MNTTPHDAPLDDKLSAWLDDELPSAQREEVEAWLRDHPEDAARARLWAADRDAVRARLGPAVEEPVPERLAQLVWNHTATTAPARWTAASRYIAGLAIFALGACLGSGATWRWLGGAGDMPSSASAAVDWEQRALVAHAVYAPEVRHPVEVAVAAATPEASRAQEEHLARWLTKRIDRPVKLFDLRSQGFELVGGRLLADGKGPCAQLMYQRIGQSAATRVTVYLRKPDSATPAAFHYEQQGDLGMFYWVEGSTGYAIVGGLPREQLLALAEAIYKQV